MKVLENLIVAINTAKPKLLGYLSTGVLLVSIVAICPFVGNSLAEDSNEKEGFFPKNFAEAPSMSRDEESSDNEQLSKAEHGSVEGPPEKDGGKDVSKRNPFFKDEDGDRSSDGRDDSDITSSGEGPPLGASEQDGVLSESSLAQEKDISDDKISADNISVDNISSEIKEAILAAQYISPIIDCQNQQLCTEALDKMHQVAIASRLPVRSILVVNLLGGGKDAPAPRIVFGKELLGYTAVEYSAKLMYMNFLPEQYAVERIPSWILGTPKGEVILDGVADPSRLLKTLRKS